MLKYMSPFLTTHTPKVLLLGNGINRVYNGNQWEGMIKEISTGKYSEEEWEALKKLPYPLFAVAASKDQLRTKLKDQSEIMNATDPCEEQADLLRQLISVGFDSCITTNYSYELEKAMASDFQPKIGKAFKYRNKTVADRPGQETEYLYQYMDVPFGEKTVPVWHIHGEAAK